MVDELHGDARTQRIRNRTAQRPFGVERVIISRGQIEIPGRLGRRHSCRDVESAARRVAAEQRALRPAQQLDSFDIEEAPGLRRGLAVVDAVDIKGDAALGTRPQVGETDTAHRDAKLAEALADLHGWERRPDIERRVDLLRLKRVAADHRDRDRRFLEAAFAAFRGDDNVAVGGPGAGRRFDRFIGGVGCGVRLGARGAAREYQKDGRCTCKLRTPGPNAHKISLSISGLLRLSHRVSSFFTRCECPRGRGHFRRLICSPSHGDRPIILDMPRWRCEASRPQPELTEEGS